jgi:hypothetical protein
LTTYTAPLAYAQHRLAHFGALLRLRCDACEELGIGLRYATQNPAPISPPAMAFKYEDVAVPFLLTVRPRVVLLAAVTLMLWALFAAWKGEGDRLTLFVFALSLSSVLYAVAYLIIGVADQFRYLYWLYNGAAIAAIVALSHVRLPFRIPIPPFVTGARTPINRPDLKTKRRDSFNGAATQ